MSDIQYSEILNLLTTIKSLLEHSSILSTGIVLLMFGIGWSSAG